MSPVHIHFVVHIHLEMYYTIFINHLFRAWLSKMDIKHNIITFEPKILEGKISSDPQQVDLVKPVIKPFLIFKNLSM